MGETSPFQAAMESFTELNFRGTVKWDYQMACRGGLSLDASVSDLGNMYTDLEFDLMISMGTV
jgi:hypothetical protein